MNTYTTNKYHKMHMDMLNICEQNGIKLMPGKRVSYEIYKDSFSNGLKDFLLTPEDFAKLSSLKDAGGDTIRIFEQDILATTVRSLMNDPDGNHCPQFIIRQLTETDDSYSFTANKVTFTFSKSLIDDLTEVPYMGSKLYVIKDAAEHIKTIYDEDPASGSISSGYGIFEPEVSAEDFIREAKKRGYLSQKHISEYKKHRSWKKENRKQIEEKYRQYQDLLLGLKTQE